MYTGFALPTGGTGEVGGIVIMSRAHTDKWQVLARRVSVKPNKEYPVYEAAEGVLDAAFGETGCWHGRDLRADGWTEPQGQFPVQIK